MCWRDSYCWPKSRQSLTRKCSLRFQSITVDPRKEETKGKRKVYLAPPCTARCTWWWASWRGSDHDRSPVRTRPAGSTGFPARPRANYVGNRAVPERAGGSTPCRDRRRSRRRRCSRRGPCGSSARSAARWWRVPTHLSYCPPRIWTRTRDERLLRLIDTRSAIAARVILNYRISSKVYTEEENSIVCRLLYILCCRLTNFVNYYLYSKQTC